MLRFDSAANLDRWIKSKERAAMVKESEDLVADFHAQRVDTSFPGWVPSDPTTGKPPNMWKTAALILLTLFPVIMLELKFLNPQLATLNPAVAHFHRQRHQRRGHHLAADAARDLDVQRLAVSREQAALAGADQPAVSARRLRGRNRIVLASYSTDFVRSREIGRRIDIGEDAVRCDWHLDDALEGASPAIAWRRHRRSSCIISGK